MLLNTHGLYIDILEELPHLRLENLLTMRT
jgi:hypothetical protein